MPASPYLVVEHGGEGCLRLALARPQRRNALDPDTVRALTGALNADRGSVAVLTSTDPRVFCAGADLTLPPAEAATVSDLLYECYETMISRPGPVIAVLHGAAVGGGAQLAAAADFRVAGRGARLRWAGPPGAELAVGAWILPELIGRAAALELTMTGRWVEAAEALALGLVSRLGDEPDQAAAQLAAELAGRRPQALAAIKQITLAGGLLDRLRAERQANRQAWDRVLAGATDDWPGHR